MTDYSLMDFENMQDELSQWLFGDKAILVTAPIADFRDSLYPPELEIISGAIEKRVFEFSTGRYCAHKALRTLGIDDFPVIRGNQREPIWPENIVGSISHCRDIAGAAVANNSNIRSIGLDIENRKQINPDIARHVCTYEEQRWLAKLDIKQQNVALLLTFSLKESVYKCIYQATGRNLHFQQLRIIQLLNKNNTDMDISLTDFMLKPREITLQYCATDSHIYSGALWHNLTSI